MKKIVFNLKVLIFMIESIPNFTFLISMFLWAFTETEKRCFYKSMFCSVVSLLMVRLIAWLEN